MTERNSTRASILNQLKNKPTGYRYSTDEYILLASDAHDYRYIYEKTEYKTSQEFIIVTCPGHGDFEVRATRHLHNNRGCPTCFPDRRGGNRKRITTSEFIARATEQHNGVYSYEKSIYEYSTKKVTVTCPKHGDFEVQASNHLRGDECKKCALEVMRASKNIGLDGFIDRARKKHGSKFDYSRATYIDSATELEIVCPDHGSFFRTPTNHVHGGYGCNRCAGVKDRMKTTADFIERAVSVHGDTYSYFGTEYKDWSTKVSVGCKEHGIFEQSVSEHLKGAGCRACAMARVGGWSRSDFRRMCSKNKSGNATLYVIKCFDEKEDFYKIGITSNDLQTRFRNTRSMPYDYTTEYEIEGEAGYIYDLEVKLHLLLKNKSYEPSIKFRGCTECFSSIKPITRLLKELSNTDQLQLIA